MAGSSVARFRSLPVRSAVAGYVLALLFTVATPIDAKSQSTVRMDSLLSAGIAFLERNDTKQAVPILEAVFAQNPAFRAPGTEPVAFYLGRAYRLNKRDEESIKTWYAGWKAQATGGLHSVSLGHAMVKTVFEGRHRAYYDEAVDVYEGMLRELASEVVNPEIRAFYMVPLSLILPARWKTITGLSTPEEAVTTALKPGAADALPAWWRSQDHIPATASNERLNEHLERVVDAYRDFGNTRSSTGLDDRGHIYIRFGKPDRREPLLPAPPDARNELWLYQMGKRVYDYLFIENQDGIIKIGLPEDFWPFNKSLDENSKVRSASAQLGALEQIYRKLALLNPAAHYGLYYERLANASNNRVMDAGADALLDQPGSATQTPSRTNLAATVLMPLRSEDRMAAHRRDQNVPLSRPAPAEDVEELEVNWRSVRLLGHDGSTRTEIYSEVPGGALAPSRRLLRRLDLNDEPSAATGTIEARLIHFDDRYHLSPSDSLSRQVILRSEEKSPQILQPLIREGDTTTFSLAVQWDVFYQEHTARDTLHIKRAVHRLDSLQALIGNPDRLEMSDLKPLRLDRTAWERSPVYADRSLTRDVPLGLSFEVYHLTFGTDDKAYFDVSYRITRYDHDKKSSRPGQRTSAETRYESESRNARETIAVDLKDVKKGGSIDITVLVRDVTTGQNVERTISFVED